MAINRNIELQAKMAANLIRGMKDFKIERPDKFIHDDVMDAMSGITGVRETMFGKPKVLTAEEKIENLLLYPAGEPKIFSVSNFYGTQLIRPEFTALVKGCEV